MILVTLVPFFLLAWTRASCAYDRRRDYVPDIASVLEKCSAAVTCSANEGEHTSTEHTLFYNGYVFSVGVKHSPCYANISHYKLRDSDVVFRLGCPTSKFALNGNNVSPLHIAQQASTLGNWYFGSRFLHGRLVGRFGTSGELSGVQVGKNEYLFPDGAPTSGMSGGAVVSDKGYSGMIHVVFKDDAVPTSLVIPAATIIAGFDDMLQSTKVMYFTKLVDCPDVQVVEIPR